MTEKKLVAVPLKDGSLIALRDAKEDDSQSMADFLSELSRDSFRQRFFDGNQSKEEIIESLVKVKDGELALVAVREQKIVGHVLLKQAPGKVPACRLYVVVSDSYTGKGIGTVLVRAAVEHAHDHGIEEIGATVLPDNTTLLSLIEKLGYPYRLNIGQGSIDVRFSTSSSEESRRIFEGMETVSARNAVSAFFNPHRIAVIGASNTKGSIGWQLFRNIVQGGFTGVVYPVNNKAESVQGIRSFKTVLECDSDIDEAIIAVPARFVGEVASQCISKGAKSLIVISSGFAETGTNEGISLQEELYDLCVSNGARLVGPNCMGLVNTDEKISLNAQFAPLSVHEGNIGFFSQSGALGIAVISEMNSLGLGLSQFISAGNKADISGNDLLEYWEQEPGTSVILMYMESFGNPRKFASISRRVSKTKPIVVVKSGRSRAGSRAAMSHTGSIVSGSDITVDTLFEQSGIIRAETLGEMFDIASILSTQPLPSGHGVAIVTNAGGAGILTADACELAGLDVVSFSEEVANKLQSSLAAFSSTHNPVDMTAEATPQDYYNTISTVCRDPSVGSVIVIFIPPTDVGAGDVAAQILKAANENPSKTVISVFIASRGIPDILVSDKRRIPSFHFPEEAVNALAKVVKYASWLKKPEGHYPPVPGGRIDQAAATVSEALADGREWLNNGEIRSLLSAYGVTISDYAECRQPSECAEAAARFGGKVALKIISPDVVHKTDAGGVKLNLAADQVEAEAVKMKAVMEAEGKRVEGFLVQPMAAQGVEMFVGVTTDGTFGPVVACGYGGVSVELFKDVAIRLPPISREDAREMITCLKSYPLLNGFRGAPVRDADTLADIVVRIGALVRDIPEILEMDLNPVIVHDKGNGCTIVDARIRVQKGKHARTGITSKIPQDTGSEEKART